MDNILPKFKTFSLEDDDKQSKKVRPTRWVPQRSVVEENARVPYYLGNDIESDDESQEGEVNPPQLPPNDRYLAEAKGIGPSPLSLSERGEAKAAKILVPTGPPKQRVILDNNDKLPHCVRFYNTCPVSMEIFMNTARKVHSIHLPPHRIETRLTSGGTLGELSDDGALELYMSTTRHMTCNISIRQEVRDFQFNAGPIGLEVEMHNHKLSCCNVFDDSQAAYFSMYLRGAEIIAVNGNRVLTMEDFQQAVMKAQEKSRSDGGFIVIQAASYRGGRLKVDDLYAHDFTRNTRQVASLLGNVFQSGLDDDHQHGIELPPSQDDNSTVSGDESTVEPEKGTSSKVISSFVEENIEHLYMGMRRSEKNEGDEGGEEESEEESSDESELATSPKILVRKSVSPTTVDDRTSPVPKEDKDRSKSPSISPPPNKKSSIKPEVSDNDSDTLAAAKKAPKSVQLAENDSKIVSVSGKRSSNASYVSAETSSTDATPFEFATALDHVDISSYKSLVCMPSKLLSSNGWGSPSSQRCMQFGNFTRNWEIEVFWVDSESLLVPRCKLNEGDRHSELMHEDHVWVIVATFVIDDIPVKKNFASILASLDSGDQKMKGYFVDPEIDVVGKTSVSIAFRPPKWGAKAITPPCVNVMWIPWVSLSISETKVSRLDAGAKSSSDEIPPQMTFHVFDNMLNNQKPSLKMV